MIAQWKALSRRAVALVAVTLVGSSVGAARHSEAATVRANSIDVSVTGPDVISTAGTYNWSATATGGSGTYFYLWTVSPDGVNWTTLSSTAAYQRWVDQYDYSQFYLKVTATDHYTSQSNWFEFQVQNHAGNPCDPFIC